MFLYLCTKMYIDELQWHITFDSLIVTLIETVLVDG